MLGAAFSENELNGCGNRHKEKNEKRERDKGTIKLESQNIARGMRTRADNILYK